jgi:hypothetical protein
VVEALEPTLSALVGELAEAAPEALGHLDAGAILFVFGAARLESRASVRPLRYGGRPPRLRSADARYEKPEITIDGRPMLYEICLRPRFFLDLDGEARLAILTHELWHIAPAFDGSLAPERRHRAETPGRFEREVSAILDTFRRRVELSPAAARLAEPGPFLLPAWRSRPPSRLPVGARGRRRYDERDLYLQATPARGG